MGIPAVLWVVGLLRLSQQNPTTAGFCVLPVCLTFIASGLHLYPFQGRLILFLVPLLLNPIAWGIASLVAAGGQSRATLPVVMGFVLIGYLYIFRDIYSIEFNRRSVPDALNKIAKSHKSNDTLYAFYSGGYRTFLWYRNNYRLNDMNIIHGTFRGPGTNAVQIDLERLNGATRVWLLLPEIEKDCVPETAELLSAL